MDKISRTYLITILADINKTDVRSAITWCERHKVKVYQDGRDKFITTEAYIKAYNRVVIEGENKQLKQITLRQKPKTYTAKGSIGKSFLESIKKQ